MKAGRSLVLTLLFLLCAACAPPREEGEALQLYFLPPADAVQGAAIRAAPYPGEEEMPDPGQLLEALLAGPAEDGLVSPFPPGLSLRAWSWKDEEPGVILVNFSEHYSGLMDISLTLADYCVALTLFQIEGVEGVEITSAGQTIAYRGHQVLRIEEIAFPGGESGGNT